LCRLALVPLVVLFPKAQPILLITEKCCAAVADGRWRRANSFDFKDATLDRQKLYFEGIKDSKISFEPFATILFRSVGRKSLAEPKDDRGFTINPRLGSPHWSGGHFLLQHFLAIAEGEIYEREIERFKMTSLR
jgi:hypothetical protein